MNLKTLKILGGIFRIGLAINLLLLLFLIIVGVAMPFNEGMYEHMSRLPVSFDLNVSDIYMEIDGDLHKATIYDASGKIKVKGDTGAIPYFSLLYYALYGLLCVFINLQIIKFIKNATKGSAFTLKSIKRIRNIGMVILLYNIFDICLSVFIRAYISESFMSTEVVLRNIYEPLFQVEALGYPLLFVAIAEILKRAVVLEEENRLTV